MILPAAARADGPELTPLLPPEKLPVPQLLPGPVGMPMPMPMPDPTTVSFQRVSMYDRWQNYSVDRYGYFRPRVVLDLPMTYYYANGRAFPLLPVRQIDYIPHIVD